MAILMPPLLRSRQATNDSAAVSNLRTINAAEAMYFMQRAAYGAIPSLIESGLLDDRFRAAAVSGYSYSIVVSGVGYVATATPAAAKSGCFGYSSAPDGVVRYSTDPDRSPRDQTGLPVQ